MGYNKGKAFHEWIDEWNKTEKLLRENNASEELILKLRDFEYEQFNRDRAFYEHTVLLGDDVFERIPYIESEKLVRTFDDLLEMIDDEEIYSAVKKADDILQIIYVLRYNGMTGTEIGTLLGTSKCAVNSHAHYFKEKFLKKLRKK